MRTIRDHVVTGGGSDIGITVMDEPGQGGANHEYRLTWGEGGEHGLTVSFQNGPIQEVGQNGVTQEALLAITIDRLRSFQKGPFACRENAIALTHCEDALLWLQKRTRDRIARSVEGTNRQ